MDNLQKKKLETAMKQCGKALLEAGKTLDGFVNGALKTMTEVLEAENALAAVSNYDLVRALRPVAQDLSELTGKRYIDIFDQAKGMILEGKDIPDVLWHFDMMLYDLKHSRK